MQAACNQLVGIFVGLSSVECVQHWPQRAKADSVNVMWITCPLVCNDLPARVTVLLKDTDTWDDCLFC